LPGDAPNSAVARAALILKAADTFPASSCGIGPLRALRGRGADRMHGFGTIHFADPRERIGPIKCPVFSCRALTPSAVVRRCRQTLVRGFNAIGAR